MTTQYSKTLRLFIFLAVSLLTLSLTGCVGGYLVNPSGWPGISFAQDTVFVAYNQTVYALDLNSGQERWSFSDEDDRAAAFYTSPAVADNLIIVGGYNNIVYALDRTSGVERWRFTEANDRIIGAPAVAGDLILIPSADGRLYALNTNTGTKVWTFPAEGSLTKALWSMPLIDGQNIYISSMDHHVYALNLETGKKRWEQDLSGAIADTPTLVNGLLLVGTFSEQMIALDVATGTTQWTLDTEGWVWGNPVVSNSVAYFGDIAGVFYAVDTENGQIIQSGGDQLDGPITSTPALDNDRIFLVTEAGTIYARQVSTNNPLWQLKPGGRLLSDPLLTGESLLVASMDTDVLVTAFDAGSGTVRWSFTPSEE